MMNEGFNLQHTSGNEGGIMPNALKHTEHELQQLSDEIKQKEYRRAKLIQSRRQSCLGCGKPMSSNIYKAMRTAAQPTAYS